MQGRFFIVSKFNRRVLDVEGASTKDGAKICAWKQKDDSDNENQLWTYDNGYFVNCKSQKVLAIKGKKIESEARVIQNERAEDEEGQAKQRWQIDSQGYIHLASHPDLVVDIRGAEDEDGAEIILYEKRSGTVAANQQWEIVHH
ncbi:ricin B lectin domain-containing protein [Mycotypha africana]|uniref:ricin B lectin domain-containing protein n=1 Tax=Mycotypha africana TaxID=64632 RepID=UPI002300E3AB|nr:ricin B lectin domain-containing protein [Mycotypha africana]KAI8981624.1 ricin B lectin domain-containing protein [Mycotypha africana]